MGGVRSGRTVCDCVDRGVCGTYDCGDGFIENEFIKENGKTGMCLGICCLPFLLSYIYE